MLMRSAAVLTVTAAALSLTACGSSGGGTPSSAATSAAKPANGAPSVAKPIDITRWQANPCALVTSGQVSGYAEKPAKPGKPENDNGAKGCGWNFTNSGPGVSFQTYHGMGLGSIYASKNNAEVFKPYSVDGYPAVAIALKGTLSNGVCSAAVAVRNDTVLLASEQAEDPPYSKNPCSGAKLFAQWAMDTITGKK